MWNRIISAILVVVFGFISSLAGEHTGRGPHSARGDHSATPSKELPTVALANIVIPHFALKTVLAKCMPAYTGLELNWRCNQHITRHFILHSTQTLQSQHALLRI
jgi:hypothetical protein